VYHFSNTVLWKLDVSIMKCKELKFPTQLSLLGAYPGHWTTSNSVCVEQNLKMMVSVQNSSHAYCNMVLSGTLSESKQ
jgi:hypothetical protein